MAVLLFFILFFLAIYLIVADPGNNQKHNAKPGTKKNTTTTNVRHPNTSQNSHNRQNIVHNIPPGILNTPDTRINNSVLNTNLYTQPDIPSLYHDIDESLIPIIRNYLNGRTPLAPFNELNLNQFNAINQLPPTQIERMESPFVNTNVSQIQRKQKYPKYFE
jgi:hypothetical protein